MRNTSQGFKTVARKRSPCLCTQAVHTRTGIAPPPDTVSSRARRSPVHTSVCVRDAPESLAPGARAGKLQLFPNSNSRSHMQWRRGGSLNTKANRTRPTAPHNQPNERKSAEVENSPQETDLSAVSGAPGFLHRPPPPADRQTSRPRRIGPSPPRARGEHSVCRLKRRGDGAIPATRMCARTFQLRSMFHSCPVLVI